MSPISKLPVVGWSLACLLAVAAQGASPQQTATYRFREPTETEYTWVGDAVLAASGAGTEWMTVQRAGGSSVELGRRVVVGVERGTDVTSILVARGFGRVKVADGGLEIWEGADAASAAECAADLATIPGVRTACPVMRRDWVLHSGFVTRPKDPLYTRQWHLENRLPNGRPRGIDLNVRAAWSVTRGEGVIVGVADNGVEITHPDLTARMVGQPHFNFATSTAAALSTALGDHGTAVSGLIGSTAENNRGGSGVAPGVGMASMVIFAKNTAGQERIVPDDALADAFRYQNDTIAVQNHSWGIGSSMQYGEDPLSDAAIEAAVTTGRGGLGTVFVRSAGNGRESYYNANDDGFAADPRVIAVAAVRMDGKAAAFSDPGACLLVAAPSGDPKADGTEDPTAPNLVTTDRRSVLGYNTTAGDGGDYGSGLSGFAGTSASAPVISGAVSLILAARPQLGYRDVQQILLLSGRHWDLTDRDLTTNGAGLRVSHNVGFGVPDCGLAVQLAKRWVPRPSTQRVVVTRRPALTIPNDTCRLVIEGTPLLPSTLRSIRLVPGMGFYPDGGTTAAPLVWVGRGNTNIPTTVAGGVALIAEGVNTFADKIARAVRAGAVAAVIYRNAGDTQIDVMDGTSYAAVPALQMGQTSGETLVRIIGTKTNYTARIASTPAGVNFAVTNDLSCERVGLHLKTTHSSRGDLRITLVSPSGTRSVLQNLNDDTTPGPTDWTYWTTHHYFERTRGTWRLEISDLREGDTGTVTFAELLVDGVPVEDSDGDGLDDAWETRWLGGLQYGPKDDPGQHGLQLVREQFLEGSPMEAGHPFPRTFGFYDGGYARLTFPTVVGWGYRLEYANELDGVPAVYTNSPGRIGEIEMMVPIEGRDERWYRVVPTPP